MEWSRCYNFFTVGNNFAVYSVLHNFNNKKTSGIQYSIYFLSVVSRTNFTPGLRRPGLVKKRNHLLTDSKANNLLALSLSLLLLLSGSAQFQPGGQHVYEWYVMYSASMSVYILLIIPLHYGHRGQGHHVRFQADQRHYTTGTANSLRA